MLDVKESNSGSLSFDVTTVSLKGARDYQEDSLVSSFSLGQELGFAILADGMGGHSSGQLASAIVVTEMFGQLKMKEPMLEEGVINIPTTLREAAEAANDRVASHTKEHAETFGMGSTLLSIMIRRDKLFWLSIGDSPLLLFRDGALRQLNKDHSMAPQIDLMVKAGTMKAEVGRDHPDRNTLTAAISGAELDVMDCPSRPIALQPDDILIIASDGLQSMSNGMIAKTLKLTQGGSSDGIANAFIAGIHELDHPEQDNAAFMVIKLGVAQELDSPTADLDDLPILAMAEDEAEDQDVAMSDTAAQVEEPETEPEPERKAYWYRGQKYFRD